MPCLAGGREPGQRSMDPRGPSGGTEAGAAASAPTGDRVQRRQRGNSLLGIQGYEPESGTTNMSTIIPKKWELLPVNHPTLLRRLVRELNSSVSGIYASGHRYSRARLH